MFKISSRQMIYKKYPLDVADVMRRKRGNSGWKKYSYYFQPIIFDKL